MQFLSNRVGIVGAYKASGYEGPYEDTTKGMCVRCGYVAVANTCKTYRKKPLCASCSSTSGTTISAFSLTVTYSQSITSMWSQFSIGR